MPARRRRPRVNRHYKIDHDLRPADRDAYLALLREPRTTIDSAHAWLAEKGYRNFSRSAVARHRRHYLEGFDRRDQLVAAAQHYAEMAREGTFSADAVTAGMVGWSETLLAQALMAVRRGEELSLEHLDEIGRLVSRMVNTRADLMELEYQRSGATDRRARGQTAPPRPDPPAVLTPEQEREQTVRRVCDILGEPYPRKESDPAGPRTPAAPSDPSSN